MATYYTTAIERLGASYAANYIRRNSIYALYVMRRLAMPTLSQNALIAGVHMLLVQLHAKSIKAPSLDITPRIIAYIARSYRPRVALASKSLYDSDFQVLDVIDQDHAIKVYNIYNEKHQLPNSDTRTLARDFNAHNPWWDPLYKARDIEGITLAD
ncbi:hypothetical protein LSUB1_G008187 [Lachnellula subtilissima]|uniref:Uncharacterized protein n=1 Tax=Lachnellula subtilissima TaxID=602034 RepID=A0A8H8RBL5_9HELO|nr:hypothetical protein LSUB1_G008187 [Lachnellula subtilissima]